ncbi:MAG: hypothetical protein AAGA16_18295 [Cyanobacteria bacterium P01_E01_bin.35]
MSETPEEYNFSCGINMYRGKEHRRIGHHNATFARLEKARNNKDLACAYAIKALTIFENQDIRLDVQEMRSLLEELSCDISKYR